MPKQTAENLSTQVLCKEPGRYIGWPTITKTRAGELLVVFSGDRDEHVCPWGKTQLVRSLDGGQTWTEPVTITDTPLDDRDAGIIETTQGTLVVSWFTSTAFADQEKRNRGSYGDAVVDGWRERIEAITPQLRARWLGNWVRRSNDGGQSWGEMVRTVGSAPHGPIELADGRLLYVGKGTVEGELALTVEESRDDARSWQLISRISIPAGESFEHYHEPHVVETATGKLVAMFRYQPEDRAQCFLRQAESEDGGATWTMARKTPIWGYPPHLIRLQNGWLLVVYGRRIPPYGERACLSKDGGRTWDAEQQVVLCEGMNGDLGYPASTQLDDGSILTVYYQIDKQGEKTCLTGTRWCLRSTAGEE